MNITDAAGDETRLSFVLSDSLQTHRLSWKNGNIAKITFFFCFSPLFSSHYSILIIRQEWTMILLIHNEKSRHLQGHLLAASGRPDLQTLPVQKSNRMAAFFFYFENPVVCLIYSSVTHLLKAWLFLTSVSWLNQKLTVLRCYRYCHLEFILNKTEKQTFF